MPVQRASVLLLLLLLLLLLRAHTDSSFSCSNKQEHLVAQLGALHASGTAVRARQT